MTFTATLLQPQQIHACAVPLQVKSTYTSAPHAYSCTEHAERQLGNSELAYFLPSRENGVNDICLYIDFHAPEHLITRARLRVVWAILRARHPLLASKVVMRDYADVSFVYTRRNPMDELAEADASLVFHSTTGPDFLDSHLNGPRILSDDRLSQLAILIPPGGLAEQNYTVAFNATHFIGDGLSMHQLANEFFSLLGGSMTNVELEEKLAEEWRISRESTPAVLPAALEMGYPPESKLGQAAGDVAFQLYQAKQIVWEDTHSLDELELPDVLLHVSHPSTKVERKPYSEPAKPLSRCSLMYSALNIRPFLPAAPDPQVLAVGYFNVILPSFLPQSLADISTFWTRAKSAKVQITKAARSPLTVSQNRRIGRDRAKNARIWAKEDDEKARGTFKAPTPQTQAQPVSPKTPSAALLGLSCIGDLGGLYRHASYPSITLINQCGGTRQRSGGMLLFTRTFAGRFRMSFQYDENGFEGNLVEDFWKKCVEGVEEFM
ncbi:hypothetical protein HWV62_36111 [Athelia sp. TMB]|nr:hypothetical protein HWV62_36111 [Athelia sp. TMB]